jgi:hypothetical protein
MFFARGFLRNLVRFESHSAQPREAEQKNCSFLFRIIFRGAGHVVIEGIALPDLIHQDVVRDPLQPLKL